MNIGIIGISRMAKFHIEVLKNSKSKYCRIASTPFDRREKVAKNLKFLENILLIKMFRKS